MKRISILLAFLAGCGSIDAPSAPPLPTSGPWAPSSPASAPLPTGRKRFSPMVCERAKKGDPACASEECRRACIGAQ